MRGEYSRFEKFEFMQLVCSTCEKSVTIVTMKKPKFPLEVKAGAVRVKIYNVSTPAP